MEWAAEKYREFTFQIMRSVSFHHIFGKFYWILKNMFSKCHMKINVELCRQKILLEKEI